jgi:hypothetical protein
MSLQDYDNAMNAALRTALIGGVILGLVVVASITYGVFS